MNKSKNPLFKFLTDSRKAGEGFTLVEMLVSLTIFSLAMMVAIRLFAFSINAEKKLMAHSQLVNEISYNMEHITRGLRKATKSEDANCLSQKALNYELVTHTYGAVTAYGIKYVDPSPSGTADCVEYYLGYPGGDYGTRAALMEWRRTNNGAVFDLPLTSPEMELLSFDIAGAGWDQNDEDQPRTTIKLEVKGMQNQILRVQTSVSQRNPDYRIEN